MDMTGIVPRIGTALLAAVLGCAIAVAQGWQHLGKLQRVEKLKDGVELTAGGANVGLTVFRDDVFRVLLAPNGAFAKGSSLAAIQPPAPQGVIIGEEPEEPRINDA